LLTSWIIGILPANPGAFSAGKAIRAGMHHEDMAHRRDRG
jgi:hypothetical protein